MRSPKNFPMLETCITPIAVLCLELADHRLISDKTIIYIVSTYVISGSDHKLTSEKTRAASPPQTQSRI